MSATQSQQSVRTLPFSAWEVREYVPRGDFHLHRSRMKAASLHDMASLIDGARDGSRGAAGELLRYYRNYLMLLATTQLEKPLARRVSPSDIVQETMLRAHQKFGQFRGSTERELLAWLRQILLNSLSKFVEEHVLAAKRDLRKEVSLDRFRKFDESASQFTAVLRAKTETPSAIVQNHEDAVLLAELLAQLPEQYRTVLVLRNLQGLSFEEVSARMDRSLGATRMLWLRAIEKMRSAYQKVGKEDEP